jgi:hypothetical protein
MWLLKSFCTHKSLVLDVVKTKLNGMSILLAKGAELQFGSMSPKYVRSIFAIRHILGNTGLGELSKAPAQVPPSKTHTQETLSTLVEKKQF